MSTNESRLILTFDQGTTRLKVAVFDLKGKCVGQVAKRNREFSEDGFSYQSAPAWWQASVLGFEELLKQYKVDPGCIIAISISGRAGAGVFVDAGGEVIFEPWLDNRHRPQLRRIRSEFKSLPLYAATLLAKLIWIRENNPGQFTLIGHALYAKDYLLFRLAGVAVTDPASGPDGLTWPVDILQQLDIDQAILPTPMLPWEIGGNLIPEASAALHLKQTIPVVVGAHDGICANTGAGAIMEREFALTLGTHGVTRTVSASKPPAANRFYGYPPEQHVIGANALMAGRSLEWFFDQWSNGNDDRQVLFKDYDARVARALPGARGVSFFPYLGGQIAPYSRARSKAGFVGLGLENERQDMYQAVLEGASFAIAEAFRQVAGWMGQPRSVSMTGSGAGSRVWVQMLADILGTDLRLTDSASEGRGAAIFAALALGEYSSLDQAIGQMVHFQPDINPDRQRHEIYQSLMQRWQQNRDLLYQIDVNSKQTGAGTSS